MRPALLAALTVCALFAMAGIPQAQTWSPSEAQKNTLLSYVTGYFTALDRGDFSAAYDFLDPALKAQLTLSQYKTTRAASAAPGDRVKTRQLVGVTWYPGQGAGGTGVAVAVDYLSETEGNVSTCGYLVWLEREAGRQFALLRDEHSSFPRAVVEEGLDALSENQRNAVLAPPACRSLFGAEK